MCSIEGCQGKAFGLGLCPKHYMRVRRHGDAMTVYKSGRRPDKTPCSIEGCQGKVRALGLCATHYYRRYSRLRPARVLRTPCSIEGCQGMAVGRGWCSKHYLRWCRYGHPETVYRAYRRRKQPRANQCSPAPLAHAGLTSCS
jgi:hypothetical protein